MLLVFLIGSKQQLSQCEREPFCIVDSQQMGVMSHTCTDHKVSATKVSTMKTVSLDSWWYSKWCSVKNLCWRFYL